MANIACWPDGGEEGCAMGLVDSHHDCTAEDQRAYEEAQSAWEAENESRVQRQLEDEAEDRTRKAFGMTFEELERELYAVLRIH